MNSEQIAVEITNVVFGERPFVSGYDRAHVDDFLDALRAAVVGNASVDDVRAMVDEARFSTRRGAYDQSEVDAFLDRVVELYAGVAPTPSPPVRPGGLGAGTPRARLDAPSGSALIAPRPGLLTRLGNKLRG